MLKKLAILLIYYRHNDTYKYNRVELAERSTHGFGAKYVQNMFISVCVYGN